MNGNVSTCNMAEALYLLHRHNRVVKVQMACTWPYGLEECAVVFEGDAVEADHLAYISGKLDADLSALPELFQEITAVLVKGGPQ